MLQTPLHRHTCPIAAPHPTNQTLSQVALGDSYEFYPVERNLQDSTSPTALAATAATERDLTGSSAKAKASPSLGKTHLHLSQELLHPTPTLFPPALATPPESLPRRRTHSIGGSTLYVVVPETGGRSQHGDVCGAGDVQTQYRDGTSASMASMYSIARTLVDKDSRTLRILTESAAMSAVGGETVEKETTVVFGSRAIANIRASREGERGDGGGREQLTTSAVEMQKRQHAWLPQAVDGCPTTATKKDKLLWRRRWQRSRRPGPPRCVPGGYAGYLSVPHVRRRQSCKRAVSIKVVQQSPLITNTLPRISVIADLALTSDGSGLNRQKHRESTPRCDAANSSAGVGRVAQNRRPGHQHDQGMLLIPTRPPHGRHNKVIVSKTTTGPEGVQGGGSVEAWTGTIDGRLRNHMVVVGGPLARRWSACSIFTSDTSARRDGCGEIICAESDDGSGDRRREGWSQSVAPSSPALPPAVAPHGEPNLISTKSGRGEKRAAIITAHVDKMTSAAPPGVCTGPRTAAGVDDATGADAIEVIPAVASATGMSIIGGSGIMCLADWERGKVEDTKAQEREYQQPETGKTNTKREIDTKVGFYSHLWEHISPNVLLSPASSALSRSSRSSPTASPKADCSSNYVPEGSTKSTTKGASEMYALHGDGGCGGGNVGASKAMASATTDHAVDGKAEDRTPSADKVAFFAHLWAPPPASICVACTGPGECGDDHNVVTPAARGAIGCTVSTEHGQKEGQDCRQPQEGEMTRKDTATPQKKLVEPTKQEACTAPSFVSHLWCEQPTPRTAYTPPAGKYKHATVHLTSMSATGNEAQGAGTEAPQSQSDPCGTRDWSGSISHIMPAPTNPLQDISDRLSGNGSHRARVAAAASIASLESNGSDTFRQTCREQQENAMSSTFCSHLCADGSRHHPETAGNVQKAPPATPPSAARTAEGDKCFFSHLWATDNLATSAAPTLLAVSAAVVNGGSDYHCAERRRSSTPLPPRQQKAGEEEQSDERHPTRNYPLAVGGASVSHARKGWNGRGTRPSKFVGRPSRIFRTSGTAGCTRIRQKFSGIPHERSARTWGKRVAGVLSQDSEYLARPSCQLSCDLGESDAGGWSSPVSKSALDPSSTAGYVFRPSDIRSIGMSRGWVSSTSGFLGSAVARRASPPQGLVRGEMAGRASRPSRFLRNTASRTFPPSGVLLSSMAECVSPIHLPGHGSASIPGAHEVSGLEEEISTIYGDDDGGVKGGSDGGSGYARADCVVSGCSQRITTSKEATTTIFPTTSVLPERIRFKRHSR